MSYNDCIRHLNGKRHKNQCIADEAIIAWKEKTKPMKNQCIADESIIAWKEKTKPQHVVIDIKCDD
jgi:hypothetical protein